MNFKFAAVQVLNFLLSFPARPLLEFFYKIFEKTKTFLFSN